MDAVLHYLPGKDGAGAAVGIGGGWILWRRSWFAGPPSFFGAAAREIQSNGNGCPVPLCGTGRYKGDGKVKGWRSKARRNEIKTLASLRSSWPVSLCVELRSILPCSAGVAFAVPLSLANYTVILRTAIDALTAVLFPAPCRICGTTLLNASRIPICDSCLASFQPIEQPMCECCGRPMPAAVVAAAANASADAVTTEIARPLCRLCRDGYYAFDRARSYGVYNDALHHAILLLKYEEVTRLGDWFAARLAEIVAREGEAFRRGRGGAGAAASRPAARTRLQPGGIDRAAAGEAAAFEARRVFADAHQATSGAIGAHAQGALGISTWRVRDAPRAAG